jgi:hypothetical protein
MAITQLLITNSHATNELSLDIKIDDNRQIREKLAAGASVDVSALCSADELNRNSLVQSLIAASKISVSDGAAGSSDIGPVVSQAELDAARVQSAKIAQVGASPFAVTIAGLGLLPMANANYRVMVGGETAAPVMVDESTITALGFSVLGGADTEVLHIFIQGALA